MASLATLEKRIESNIKKAWYENGLCMMEICERKLYKKKHKTFEEYLEKRWEYTARRGYQLIDAAKTYQLIESVAKSDNENVYQNSVLVHKTLPKNESQIRPLMELSDDSERVHVWNKVVESEEKPTRAKVKVAVDAFKANPEPVVVIEKEETNLTSSDNKVLYSSGANDECYTPDYAVHALIPHLNRFKNKIIWCPFDKADSHFVKILIDEGFQVIATHINDGWDFYKHEPEKWDVIASNPPFTDKRKIFERALSFKKPFALIMSNTWLNDAAPKQIFRERGLQLLMFEERMKFLNQDNTENKITFSSSYFCCDFLKKDIMFDSLKGYGYGN